MAEASQQPDRLLIPLYLSKSDHQEICLGAERSGMTLTEWIVHRLKVADGMERHERRKRSDNAGFYSRGF